MCSSMMEEPTTHSLLCVQVCVDNATTEAAQLLGAVSAQPQVKCWAVDLFKSAQMWGENVCDLVIEQARTRRCCV